MNAGSWRPPEIPGSRERRSTSGSVDGVTKALGWLRRPQHLLWLVIPVVAACAILVAVAGSVGRGRPATESVPSVHVTKVEVRGTGPTSSVLVFADDHQVVQQSVTLPFTLTMQDNPALVQVTAEAPKVAGATIACEIDHPGTNRVTNASHGPGAVVTCTTRA